MKFQIEYTDTFGGEANYSWCKRREIELHDNVSDLTLVRKAKDALGLTNVRCRRECLGDWIVLYPIGSATVVYIVPSI